MCEGYVEKPLYLLIAEWMMAENRWVIAREISIHFDIEHSKAVNTLTYILSEVTEISCEVKMIPNKLEGRGCQCQRLVKVVDIDEQIYARLRNNSRDKLVGVRKTPRIDAPRDKCTLSCAINGIHAAFHYLKKNYISGCVMTVPTG
ncbi:TPA: carnitine metabolism transcriptional regulator CaiF [Escherichia coli]|nr:carnitine metabolism transcriptional regulator CaiF [Escherichia coli]